LLGLSKQEREARKTEGKKTRFEKWKEARAENAIKKAEEDKIYKAAFEEAYKEARLEELKKQAKEKAQLKAKGGKGFNLAGTLAGISKAVNDASNSIEGSGLGNVARQGGFLTEEDIFGVSPKRKRDVK
jgi:hypothetical protein